MFKPPLNGEPGPPEPKPMVQFYIQQISWTECKVW